MLPLKAKAAAVVAAALVGAGRPHPGADDAYVPPTGSPLYGGIWPLPNTADGRACIISDGYHWRNPDPPRLPFPYHHGGVDLTFPRRPSEPNVLPHGTLRCYTPARTAIVSPFDGVVSLSEDQNTGGCVRVTHFGIGGTAEEYFATQHHHMAERHVEKGDHVRAGQVLGVVGHSIFPGSYTFDHDHCICIGHHGLVINPEPILAKWRHIAHVDP